MELFSFLLFSVILKVPLSLEIYLILLARLRNLPDVTRARQFFKEVYLPLLAEYLEHVRYTLCDTSHVLAGGTAREFVRIAPTRCYKGKFGNFLLCGQLDSLCRPVSS